MKTQPTTRTVYIEARTTSEYGESPTCAKIDVSQSFLDTLIKLQELLVVHSLSEVRQYSYIEWLPEEFENEHRLLETELVVAGTCFWFESPDKHSESHIETDSIRVDKFIADVGDFKELKPLYFGDGLEEALLAESTP